MPEQTDRSHFPMLVAASLAATWFVWGSTYLAIKFALVSLPPFLGMGTRFIVAGGILIAWTLARGRSLPTALQWRNAAVVGALMLGGGMGGTAYAEQSVASGLVVAFIAITPGVMTLLNLLYGLRPSRLETIGIAIGIAGVLFLVRGSAFSGSPSGLSAIFLGCVCWSVGSVLSQRSLPLAPAAVGFASEMLCGGVFLLIMAYIAGEPIPRQVELGAIAAWGYLVVFGSLIAFNAYMTLLAHTSAALATSYTFVNPIIAMILGIWLGGEVVTGHEWVASGVVVIGVIILVLARARTAPQQ
jgi:drug/metabolite transporter (DMT)-like permease